MNSKGTGTFKSLARQAKQRMKSGYWADFDKKLKNKMERAEAEGLNPSKVAEYYVSKTIKEVNGKKDADEEFYRKVRDYLLKYGETSDIIGRLVDQEVDGTMSYEQRQRAMLVISNKYLDALERFKKEKEYGLLDEM